MNHTSTLKPLETVTVASPHFLRDVLKGLRAPQKFLESKYFYDGRGDELFQHIMHCPEYYPTDCEFEILSEKTGEIIDQLLRQNKSFDIVELGAGDALKSTFLLRYLQQKNVEFTYYPIDISANVISLLEDQMPQRLPGLSMRGLHGEYFEMLKAAGEISKRPKLVLFLGGNIGNMFPEDAKRFCVKLREHLNPGDMLLIGFDLKKDPRVILKAYNDVQGFTRAFNLNLLNRINNELDANFEIDQFEHYPTYDPETGACKSYLVSLRDQHVCIGPDQVRIDFKENECIHMEISQKYTVKQTDLMAITAGFTPMAHFCDSRKWYIDAIWKYC